MLRTNFGMEGDKRLTICRLCLSGTDDLIHVFERKWNHTYAPADVITELLRQEVSSEDSYPQCVCACCMRKLEDFKHFKDQCEECRELLDRAHSPKDVSSMEIIPREIEIDKEGGKEPIADDTVMVAEVGFSITNSVQGCTEGIVMDCPDAVNERISSSLPLKELHTLEIFTASQEEAEYSQDGVRDPLGSDESDDENFSRACGWRTDPDDPDPNYNEMESTDDGDSRNGSKDPLACGDYKEEALPFTSKLEADPEKPALEPDEEEYAVDEESFELKESQHSSGSTAKETELTSKIFKCLECSKGYSCPIEYSRHLQEHGLGTPLKCKISVLTKSSSAKRTGSRAASKFSCHICSKVFKHQSSLHLHMAQHGDKVFSCSVCGKDFPRLSDMKTHESFHAKKIIHECNICDKTFTTKMVLKKHVALHNKNKVECNHCEKVFFTVKELRLHRYCHSEEKVHECDECGERFHSKFLVVKHKRTHKKIAARRHLCSECDQTCLSASDLRVHMRTHTGEKPFSCSFCGRCFSVKFNLKIHVQTQHSEWKPTPVQCDECGRWCSNIRILQYHKKTTHF